MEQLKLDSRERDELKRRVLSVSDKKLSCLSVLANCYSGKTKPNSVSVFFECPNGCNTKDVSSCSIPKNASYYYKCFKCGEGGNALKLESLLTGESYFDIAIEEAYSYNLINKDEYDYLINKPGSKEYSPKPKRIETTKQHVEEKIYFADADTKNLVYSTLLSLPQFSLTNECIEYLKGRGVKEFDGFFCHHEDFDMKTFITLLKDRNPEFEHKDLCGVPGFFFVYSDKEKTKGCWRFLKKAPNSVIITVKDAMGRIVGLQVRNMAKGSRYYWLSSLSENENDLCGFGSSPGSPVHVQYPSTINSGFYTFTEGFFKVKRLSEVCNSVGFSLQGVTNSRDIVREVKASLTSPRFKERMTWGKEERKKVSFNFFFDADMIAKYQVYSSVKKCYELLHEGFPMVKARFHVWPIHYGKGFDDLMDETPDWNKKIKVFDADEFCQIMDEQIEKTRLSFGEERTLAEIHQDDDEKKLFQMRLYQSFWRRVSQ